MESKRLSIFADDVIEYTENSKGSTKKKKLYLIKEFSKVVGYKLI